jgi:signal transduction histidine kinase
MVCKQVNILVFVSDSSQSQTATLVTVDNFGIDSQNFEEILQEAVARNYISVVKLVNRFDEVLTTLDQVENIDAVILDLLLQDELEQISRIHQLFPNIAIIVVNDWDDEAIGQVIDAGGDDCLSKTQMNPQLLRRSLLNAIARHKRQQDDITKRKQSELKLRESKEAAEVGSRAKSAFLATMSHELRTPLNAIMGLSQLLQQQEMVGNLNDKQMEYVNCIYSSGEHLLALINDILDLSKVEAGKEELHFVTVIVEDLCNNVISTVCDRAHVKGLRLNLDIDENINTCIADERRLKQMLLNLLTNAIKFTQVGSISLSVTQAESGISFIVTDTGIGIDPQHFKLLFEPFKQLDSQLNRQYEGTGLGLALTRRLARLHGGDVMVESTLGVGSRFTLLLPHNPQVPSQESNTDLEIEAGNNSIPASLRSSFAASGNVFVKSLKRILLVEDEEHTAILLQDYLQTIGYRVELMMDGNGFLEKVDTYKPDLILLDVQLADGINGLDVLNSLRQQPNLQDLPIVMMTPMGTGERDRFLQVGANDCLNKPIGIFQLESILMKYLN